MLQLSGLHYLPVSAVQGTQLSTAIYKEAYDVKVGDFVWIVNEWSPSYLYAAKVTANVNVTAYGDIMPLTMKVWSPVAPCLAGCLSSKQGRTN